MAIIVEDGTVVADANSLASVVFADAYFLNRGNSAWAALTEADKEVALIKGTDYFSAVFGGKLNGRQITPEQCLPYPRDTEIGVPNKVQQAISEYALISTTQELFQVPELSETGNEIEEDFVKIGPIEIKSVLTTSKTKDMGRFPRADMLIRGFVSSAASQGGVVK